MSGIKQKTNGEKQESLILNIRVPQFF